MFAALSVLIDPPATDAMPDHRLSLEPPARAYQGTHETLEAQPEYCTCPEYEESDDFEFPSPSKDEEHVWRPRIKRFVKHFLLHEEEDVEPPPVPEKDYKYLRRCRMCGLAIQGTPESSSPTAQSPVSSISPTSPAPQIPDKPLPRIPTPPSWPWSGLDPGSDTMLHLDGPPSFPEPHPFNEEHSIYITTNPDSGDRCSICPPGQLDFSQDEPSPPQSPSRSDRYTIYDSPTTMVASPSMHQMLTGGSLPPSPITASPTAVTSPAGVEFSSAAEEKRALTVRNADEPAAAAPPESSSSACAGPLPLPASPPPAYTPWPMGHQETCAETSYHHADEDDQDAEPQWASPLHRRLSGMPSFGSALNEDHALASTASVDPPGSPADVIEDLLRDVDAVAEEYQTPMDTHHY